MQDSIGNLIMREERFMQVTMRNIVDAYVKPRGFKPIHAHLVSLLDVKEGQTIKELCVLARIKPSNLSPICRELEEASLVRRERNVSDKRSIRLFLTPEGQRFLEELNAWIDQVLSSAGDENAELHSAIAQGFAAFRTLIQRAKNTNE